MDLDLSVVKFYFKHQEILRFIVTPEIKASSAAKTLGVQ